MRHVLCGAVMCCAVCDVCWRREIVLHAPEMLEGMRRVQLCMLEAVEGELCLLEVPEVIRCVLEAVEGALCLLEVLEVLEMPEVMRCVLLCILEAVEGGLCSLEVPEVMRGYTLYAGGCGGWSLFVGGVGRTGGAGGDALCATLYSGGCGG